MGKTCLIDETDQIQEKSSQEFTRTETEQIQEKWEEPSWVKGKSEEFKRVAIALLSNGFLYCGKFNEFYDHHEIKPIAIVKNWVVFISPDESFDVYSEEELFTLPLT
jgi:hypothetical protein